MIAYFEVRIHHRDIIYPIPVLHYAIKTSFRNLVLSPLSVRKGAKQAIPAATDYDNLGPTYLCGP